jgi:hypothetical protein
MMTMRGQHRLFQAARAFAVRSNSSYQEWLAYCQGNSPPQHPRNPRDTYRDKGWAGFPDWLGTDNIAYRQHVWRAFKPARAFVRKLKLPNTTAWRAYVRGDYLRLPVTKGYPPNPDRIYPVG